MENNSETKTYICPQHGVELIRMNIFYGLPHFTDDLQKLIDNGEIILGGCIMNAYGKHGFICQADKEQYFLEDNKLISFKKIGERQKVAAAKLLKKQKGRRREN